ncbi:MAG TPA: ATP-binding protein [Actinomycetota bacterium]|nr:ATP-binding protein [Actinomycetota bacterium]
MNDLVAFLLGAALTAAVAYGGARLRRPRREGAAPGADPSELERQRRRTDDILERMNEGVVVLDDRLRPLFANSPARALLGLPDVSLPRRVPSEALSTLAWRSLREGRAIEQVIELWFPARTSLRARVAPIDDDGVVVVVQDVTQELRTQRVRREFVAHASHELKSPVAGVQVLAEAVLEAVKDDPAAVAGFAERIVKETDRLGHLIADLLDLSRLEEAERVPETPVDLSDVVGAEVTSAGFVAERKGTNLESDVQPGVWVRGERTQLGNLVRNLLENAVHYTPPGGRVVVSLERDEAQAVLTVSDDGIGIPHEAQQRVFERFYRVDGARSRDTGGTGLGLAIVKHVAELHGGTVGVESELGRGSSFCTRLPAIPPRGDAAGSLAG